VIVSEFQSRAVSLDESDVLARFRSDFYIRPGRIYLDGNSLGLASKAAESAVLNVLAEWKDLGIEGWTDGSPSWLSYSRRVASLLAPLVGATADAIAVGNSTTVNLHQILSTLFDLADGRTKILVDALSFPSNLYAVRSHLKVRGLDPQSHLIVVPSRDGLTICEADIIERFTNEIRLAVLPSVLFQSGQLLDLKQLISEARNRGILIGFDCSHSVGVVPHALDALGADFACWCTYKYLNSGPGGASALYLNARHFGRHPGMAGWFGSRADRQFSFSPEFEPAPDAQALEIATPNILSTAPLLGTLAQISDAGIDLIRKKSLELTTFLIDWFDRSLAPLGFTLVTPRDASRRGGHISLSHPEAARICRTLRDAGVVTDFRPPTMIRITPSPLYTSFGDVCEAVRRTIEIVESRAFERQQAIAF
jgi:kynureninase